MSYRAYILSFSDFSIKACHFFTALWIFFAWKPCLSHLFHVYLLCTSQAVTCSSATCQRYVSNCFESSACR
ncbi:hypothetical protein C8J56DRAFT_976593 [Mycena floridula]|nr:hypothetical protein C8J56DRAFT_976593 [Mycena floridula]